jgi:hypothetical protein
MERQRAGRTGHLTYPFANSATHTHNANLPKRILVKPLGDERACVFERKVEPRRPHITIPHRRREVQQENEMADYRTADRGRWREQSFIN